MYPFHYQKASSVAQASAALARSGESRLLSGGMTLIPSLKHRLIQVDELIDITGIPGLSDIRMQGNRLWIGAGATHQQVAQHAQVCCGIAAALPRRRSVCAGRFPRRP